MNRQRLLAYRNSIYGFCAVWILVFHIYRNTGLPTIPIISNVLRLGNLGVDIFLFLSGVCLCLSAARHRYSGKQWLEFFRRRAFRVLLPYLIVAIPFFCWAAVCEHSGGLVRRAALFFSDLFYISFFLKGSQTIWFVFGIMLCYLLFPLLYRWTVKAGFAQKLFLLLGVLLFAFAASFLPYLQNLEIVWARLPIFVLGVYYGTSQRQEEKEQEPSVPLCAAALLTILLLGWVVSSDLIPSHTDTWLLLRWLVYIPVALAFLFLASHFGQKSKVLTWLGGLSLEIYIVHITAIHQMRYYDVLERLGAWTYLLLPLNTIPLAWCVHKLAEQIQKRLKGSSS